jgi:hypothetical protein
MLPYVELHCKTNFSFLEGASHAHELVDRAREFGYRGLAITDRDTLAGIVRAHTAAKDTGIPFFVGCELNPVDGPPVVVWPRDRQGYGELCRLLSIGRLRGPKGTCELSWHDIAAFSGNWLAGLVMRLPSLTETSSGNSGGTILPQMADSPSESFHADSSDALPLQVEPLPGEAWCPAGIGFDGMQDTPWLQWLGQFRETMRARCGGT